MAKFKAGDIVRCVGIVREVLATNASGFVAFVGLAEVYHESRLDLIYSPSSSPSYPNPPHKHAAIIKAWADGAMVQVYSDQYQAWVDVPGNNPPKWTGSNYRIKPDEVRALEHELDEALNETGRLKAELKRLNTEDKLL